MIKYWMERTERELKRAMPGDSGYDVMASLNSDGAPMVLMPGQRKLIPTGLYTAMPPGVEAQVRSRSGLSVKQGVVVINAPGTIDSHYRGEVQVALINLGQENFTIKDGDRIAQLVFAPVFPDCDFLFDHTDVPRNWTPTKAETREHLGVTARGDGGFGSTGV